MADKTVQIVIEADDQASGVIQRIGQNLSGISDAASNAASSMTGYSSKVGAALENVRGNWGNLKNKISEIPGVVTAATGISLGAIVKMGVGSAAAVESSRAAFKTLTGSAEEAERIILRIQDAAKKTPFDQQALTNMNQTLIGSGIAADTAFSTVLQLGDALAATGKGSAELTRVGNTISQVFGKGKADAVDFKELVNAGWVTVRKDVAETMKVTSAEFEDMVSNGEIGFDQLQQTLKKVTGEGGRFFGAMEAQSQTFNGAMSNLIDTLNIQLGTLFRDTGMFDAFKNAITGMTAFLSASMPVIIQGFRDVFAILAPIGALISSIVSPFAQFVSQHQELQRVIAALVIGFGLFVAAMVIILPIITLFSTIFGIIGAIGTLLISIFTLLGTVVIPALIAVFTFLLSPLGLIVLAIAAIIAIGYLLITHWEQVKAFAASVWTAIAAAVTAAWEKIKAFIPVALNAIWSVIVAMFTLMFGTIQQKMTLIQNIITTVLKAVDNAFGTNLSAAWGKVQSFAGSVMGAINSIIGAIDNLIGKLRELADKAGSAIGSAKGKLGFQHGGVIPGSFNQAVPAVLHGGERIVPRNGVDVNPGQSGGGGGSVNIIIEGDVNSTDTLSKIVEAVKAAIGRDSELAQLGVSI